MSHEFPPGELLPDDELGPVTVEATRYVYQLKRVNRVVVGLRELDASLGEKIRVAKGLLDPVNASLTDTHRALQTNTSELAAQHASLEELVETVKALAARLPDPKRVRYEIQGDLWQEMEPLVVEPVAKVGNGLDARVIEAGARLAEAAERGFMAPARPKEGSPLGVRLRYRKDRLAYQVKKFAADWLAVTQIAGLATLFCIVLLLFVLAASLPH